jgi:hypothetical protein
VIFPVLDIERVFVALAERGRGKLLVGVGQEAIDDRSKGGVGRRIDLDTKLRWSFHRGLDLGFPIGEAG